MLVISSREFRENQAKYMDMVDTGEQVVVQRGKNKSYSLVPLSEDDVLFSPLMKERIQKSLLQIQQGESTTIQGLDALNDFLAKL